MKANFIGDPPSVPTLYACSEMITKHKQSIIDTTWRDGSRQLTFPVEACSAMTTVMELGLTVPKH
ncbi:hypothetical protein A2U01_0028470, partial [Trifolium medium]|nr:hypothetical protein [Trifolium medium]